LAVRLDQDQAVKAGAAGGVKGRAHADPDRLAPLSLTAESLFLGPVEALSPLIQRFRQIRTGDRTLFGADLAVMTGRVDAADSYPVDAELAGGLCDERLDRRGNLILARTSLGIAGRGVGQHRHAAPAHRHRLIDQ